MSFAPSITLNDTTEPFELQVARGQVQRHRVVNFFGFNENVGTSFTTLWSQDSDYIVPPSASAMTLVSNSASDTAVSVLIEGLDADYNEIQEVLVTNGTTDVTTANSYLRINKMLQVIGFAVGDITISVGASVYGRIAAGVGASQMSQYTVPNNSTFYLYRISGWSATAIGSSKYISFRNHVETNGGNATNYNFADATFINTFEIIRQFPFKYDEKSTIKLQAKSSSTTNHVAFAAEGILISNTGF
jgi:hypothetical protein